jgi:hypothetical protein
MTEERTEEQILSREPILVFFGGKSYEVPILTILKGRKWREQVISSGQEIAGKLTGETNGRDATFFVGLATVLLGFPEKLADLVFAYAPGLPKDEILENGTDEEIAIAFSSIMKVAFPFSRQISMMGSILQAGQSLSASAKSTSSSSQNGESSRIQ